MVKVLILYYLSIKSTHGYEIQKFIQVNHMDSWTKIQSGSIYYALSKLEKEGLICLFSEEEAAGKTRKIYSITEKGKRELYTLVLQELSNPISEIGADKFVLYPLLTVADKPEIIRIITAHIEELGKKKSETEGWQRIKLASHALEVEKLSFEMMISSLDYQMKWHQALLSQLDQCMEESERIGRLILAYDFTNTAMTKSCAAFNAERAGKREKNM